VNAAFRLAALRERLEGRTHAALAVTCPANVAYITGFERVFDDEEAHAAVVTTDIAVLYTDTRYFSAASSAAQGTEWEVRVAKESVFTSVCADLASAGVGWLGLETSMSYGRFDAVSAQFEGTVEPTDNWVEEIRQVKTAEEIERIAAAQRLTDVAFEHVLGIVKRGMTEVDVALELEFFMRREGSEGVAFAPIVASGPNSALPHAKVTDRVLGEGDFLKLDFGARVDGYCADMTRTIVIGQASERHREIYDAVLAANVAGIDAVRPGLPGKSIDAAARSVIEARGLGEFFGHGLGHGVGMEVHELPSVGPRGVKDIPAGSVITIEPGVYVPGFGGVRIEDLVVVEEAGARVLTSSPKGIIEL